MNIVRLYNQNRKQLFTAIIIVVFIIAIIQYLNYLTIKENEENSKKIVSSSSENATTYNITISSETKEKQIESITKFIEYCNNGEVKEAYAMLSSVCKKEEYPTLEDFKKCYYNKIFYIKRDLKTKIYADNLYSVILKEDILSSGKVENREYIEDYYEVVEENYIYKISIGVNL